MEYLSKSLSDDNNYNIIHDMANTRTIQENRKILRRYIRLLSQFPGMMRHKQCKDYLVIVHNFLGIEEMFYDQCLMGNKQINVNLGLLLEKVMFETTAMAYSEKIYDPNHKVRFAIETFDSIEDVRVFMDSDECKKLNIYTKLVLDYKFKKAKV